MDFYADAIDKSKWYGFWNYGDVMHAYDFNRHDWMYDVGGMLGTTLSSARRCGFGIIFCAAAILAPGEWQRP